MFGGRLTETGWGIGVNAGSTGTSPINFWMCASGTFDNHRLIPVVSRCEALPLPFGYSLAVQHEASHQLLAVLAAAFNILLHIIYRKRPDVEPCAT